MAGCFFDDIIEVLRQEAAVSGGTLELSADALAGLRSSGAPSGPGRANASRRPTGAGTTGPRRGTAGADSAPPRHQSPLPASPPRPSAPLGTMGFDELQATAMGCQSCKLAASRTNVVFEDGDRQAELMFIGEGPGRDEDEQGIPFVGRAGQLLTRMITAMQFDRRQVYIANIVKCRPPQNRNPEPDEAEACMPFLRRQVELVAPKVIVLLGAVPLNYILGGKSIMAARGQWAEFMGIKTMATYHPAYLLRNAKAKEPVWEDMQKVMAAFGKYHRK